MRNLLALVGLAVIGFGGVGWYMGWYQLSFTRTPEGNLQINTTVDTKKAGAESSEFFRNIGSAISTHAEKAAQDAKTSAPQAAPGTTPGPVVPAGQTQPSGSQPNVPLPELPLVPGPTPQAPRSNTPAPIPLLPPK